MKSKLTLIVFLSIISFGVTVSGALAVDGPLANATVSFGEWKTDPVLNRFPNNSPAAANNHAVIPDIVTIKSGGAINFVISGLHLITVYDAGTQPDDVNTNLTDTTTGAVPSPAVVLINDPDDRIYRGLDPSLHPRDRVEAISFSEPGTYLVICGIRNHFVNDGMFGYVRVLPATGN